MSNKPTAAFVLSLIGGIFILIGGGILAALGSILFVLIGGVAFLFIIGLVIGLLTIVGAVMLYMKPQQHVMWGVLLIVFAFLSIPFALGGVFLGFILTLIGGIMALVFKPMEGMMMPGAPMPGMMPGAMPGTMPGAAPAPGASMNCPYCGGPVNMQTRTCTMCGKPVP